MLIRLFLSLLEVFKCQALSKLSSKVVLSCEQGHNSHSIIHYTCRSTIRNRNNSKIDRAAKICHFPEQTIILISYNKQIPSNLLNNTSNGEDLMFL